ncbi:MAG: anhydro-N-acetylmuramic acid kinase [Flavobacteriaceae bacterium]|nr:anhydro-N-acetylmuramic acid kinase [Flavobacteriaceae bacterium]
MEENNIYRVLGVMSGTSLDGVDLALIEFKTRPWKYDLLETATLRYPENWIKTLSNIHKKEIKKIVEIDTSYTLFLGKLIDDFINYNKIDNIDFVCSHGHTAIHRPYEGMTYQLGNLSSINKYYNLKTICDFRKQDVDNGGQGAPLVPIGDKILFPEYSACLNFGGFANISRQLNGKTIAYDICSTNLIFNYLAKKKSMSYDKNGILAKSGKIIGELFNRLNNIDFYNLPHPKSLGVEWNEKNIYPLINKSLINNSIEDVMRTYLEHAVLKISQSLKNDDTVLVTGGGAHNKFLVSSLKSKTQAKIIIPSKELIDYKEALIFGLLGLLRVLNINNCLSSVTGSKNDHCSGKIF